MMQVKQNKFNFATINVAADGFASVWPALGSQFVAQNNACITVTS